MSLTLQQIQNDHAAWAKKNFPDAVPMHAAGGLAEEVGELWHAVLKREQGIRGYDDPEKFVPEAQDAVGDILIYLLHFCTIEGWDLHDILQRTWADTVQKRDWRENPETAEKAGDYIQGDDGTVYVGTEGPTPMFQDQWGV